jgi:transcriptional regulator with XRE-family HTH domain
MEREKETRKSKGKLPPPVVRGVLALNVRVLRDRKWPEEKSATARNRKIAAATGMSRSQAARIAEGSLGPSIDYVERLATLFDVRPQDLLTPYFCVAKEQPSESSPAAEDDRAELQRSSDRKGPARPKS